MTVLTIQTDTICCRTCGYYSEDNECRRYAPLYMESLAKTVWPTTRPDDWCGEWDTEDAPLDEDVNG